VAFLLEKQKVSGVNLSLLFLAYFMKFGWYLLPSLLATIL